MLRRGAARGRTSDELLYGSYHGIPPELPPFDDDDGGDGNGDAGCEIADQARLSHRATAPWSVRTKAQWIGGEGRRAGEAALDRRHACHRLVGPERRARSDDRRRARDAATELHCDWTSTTAVCSRASRSRPVDGFQRSRQARVPPSTCRVATTPYTQSHMTVLSCGLNALAGRPYPAR